MNRLAQAITGTDVNSAAPVLQASQNIQMTMQASTAKVNGAQALGVFDALSLQDTANSLVTSVNTTMKDLAAKKPQLDMLGVTMVAVQSIQDQKTASKALGDAIVSKVPGVGQGIAQGSIDQINAALDGGIKMLSAGAAGGGAMTGGTMSGGSNRNSSSSSSGGNGVGSGVGSGKGNGNGSSRNSTSGSGTDANSPALNPAQPADAGDRPSTGSAQLSGMMTSSAAAMPGTMTSSVTAAPDMMPSMMPSTTTAMMASTMMSSNPASSSVMTQSGAASLGGNPAAVLAGGLALVAAIWVF